VNVAEILPGSMQWFDRLHGALQGAPLQCSGTSCGGEGAILLTNDGGQTWHEVPFQAVTAAPAERLRSARISRRRAARRRVRH